MSRVGKLPIPLPDGVTCDVGQESVKVKGPKGQLEQAIVAHVDVAVGDGQLEVTRRSDMRQARANHGLMRSLLANMVEGVTNGFTKQLEVIGVGYRADVRGRNLVMNLGYSHPIEYSIPDGVDIDIDKKGIITVGGIDKQQVGQAAAEIRAFRQPDSYKGKGVRFVGERVRLKAGKSA